MKLGEQREGLSQVVSNLQQAFSDEAHSRQVMTEQVDQSLVKINATVTEVNKLATAIGLNSSERLAQLQELARTIGNEATRVENSYQQLTGQFRQSLEKMNQAFDVALTTGNQQLSDYLEKAQSSYIGNLREFDQSAAKLYSNLNESSSGLMSVAEYLVAASNDLRRSNNQ
jgi:DNA anti-recombination protein RmuC